jgi:hypothetical protein
VVPEEQDVHADHDGYQREHVKHYGRLFSHRFVSTVCEGVEQERLWPRGRYGHTQRRVTVRSADRLAHISDLRTRRLACQDGSCLARVVIPSLAVWWARSGHLGVRRVRQDLAVPLRVDLSGGGQLSADVFAVCIQGG